eukprot:jgi/Ulvmu1/6207/UM028_0063.1
MRKAQKPPSEASSSDDGSPAEFQPDQFEDAAVQQLQHRSTHSKAVQSSSSADADSGGGVSSDVDSGAPSGGDDEHDHEEFDNIADMSMGERVANLSYGPYHSSRRQWQRPGMLPVGKRATKTGSHVATAGESLNGDPAEFITRRSNKNAPVEEPIAHRPVSAARDAVQRKSVKAVDPRFLARNRVEDQREADLARRRFGFIYDQSMPSEVKELKAAMHSVSSAGEHRQLQTKLSRLQQSMKLHQDRSLELQVEHEWKLSQKAQIEAGKRPYYMKDSEKKKRVMEKRFAHLEETGQLEKYMTKKRKRVASKLHKKLPFRRKHE